VGGKVGGIVGGIGVLLGGGRSVGSGKGVLVETSCSAAAWAVASSSGSPVQLASKKMIKTIENQERRLLKLK
jgi:hypothetical protein